MIRNINKMPAHRAIIHVATGTGTRTYDLIVIGPIKRHYTVFIYFKGSADLYKVKRCAALCRDGRPKSARAAAIEAADYLGKGDRYGITNYEKIVGRMLR